MATINQHEAAQRIQEIAQGLGEETAYRRKTQKGITEVKAKRPSPRHVIANEIYSDPGYNLDEKQVIRGLNLLCRQGKADTEHNQGLIWYKIKKEV